MRAGAVFAFALACSPAAPAERATPPSAAPPAPVAASAASAAEAAPADTPAAAVAVRLEQVLVGEDREELDWEIAAIREGLLVVPGDAHRRTQLVGSDRVVRPLPDLFKGLRFKAGGKGGWDVDDFRVMRPQGSLDKLSFSIDVPSSGFASQVEGRAGHFTIKPQTSEALYDQALVALPVTTPRGARLYQVLPGSTDDPMFGLARRGARFAFDGPSRGERLPVPAQGANGCSTKLLGHPFLAYVGDGALLAVGTVCTSGDARLPVVSVNGSGLYASGAATLGEGALAVELFQGGAGTVTLLPGAPDPVPDSDVELRVLPEGRAMLVARTLTEKGPRPYVAFFDGTSWTNVTPPEIAASELGLASLYLSPTGAIYLFAEGNVFRRTGALPFRKLVYKAPPACVDRLVFARPLGEWPGGALLFGAPLCPFVVRPDDTVARLLELPGVEEIVDSVAFGDDLYLTLRNENYRRRLVRAILLPAN